MFDLMFNLGPAIMAIFQIGFEPKEEDFYELTEEQYVELKAEGTEINCKWYLLLPKDYSLQGNEVITVNENQKDDLLRAAEKIESYCTDIEKIFKSYKEKLYYVAELMPKVFSEGTKFQRSHLKRIK